MRLLVRLAGSVLLATSLASNPGASLAQTAPLTGQRSSGEMVATTKQCPLLYSIHLTLDQAQQFVGDFRAMQTANLRADATTKKANEENLRQQLVAILDPAQRSQYERNAEACAAAHNSPAAPARDVGTASVPAPR